MLHSKIKRLIRPLIYWGCLPNRITCRISLYALQWVQKTNKRINSSLAIYWSSGSCPTDAAQTRQIHRINKSKFKHSDNICSKFKREILIERTWKITLKKFLRELLYLICFPSVTVPWWRSLDQPLKILETYVWQDWHDLDCDDDRPARLRRDQVSLWKSCERYDGLLAESSPCCRSYKKEEICVVLLYCCIDPFLWWNKLCLYTFEPKHKKTGNLQM